MRLRLLITMLVVAPRSMASTVGAKIRGRRLSTGDNRHRGENRGGAMRSRRCPVPAKHASRTHARRRTVLATRALLALAFAIAAALPAQYSAAAPMQYPSLFENLTDDLGSFWAGQFAAAGLAYTNPGVRIVNTTLRSDCGPMSVGMTGAYCSINRTIYLSGPAAIDMINRDGDFAWVVVVAHEWGHHVQNLLAVPDPPGSGFELQADCLAGAFAKNAESRGLLGPGDMAKAVHAEAQAGDPPMLPNDTPGAHGNGAERMASLMNGYSKGVAACGLPWPSVATVTPVLARTLAPAPAPPPAPAAAAPVPAPGTVPAAIFLPQGQVFRVEQQGPEAMDAGLAQFGWTSGEYRIFASDNPPPGAAGWVEIHRLHFGSVAGASQALAFLAQNRAATNGLAPLGPAGIGDESAALSGPAYNGTEYTVFVRSGADLLRVTGISPSGVPSQDVIAAALQALAG